MSTQDQQKERSEEMKERFVFFAVFAAVVLFGMMALQGCVPAGISLEDTNWQVTEINGQPILENTDVTMEFGTTDLGGKASCNSYFATYQQSGSSLSVKDIGQTEMYCMDDGVMDQETLFLQSLAKSDTITISGDTLTITLADGGSITLMQQ